MQTNLPLKFPNAAPMRPRNPALLLVLLELGRRHWFATVEETVQWERSCSRESAHAVRRETPPTVALKRAR